MTAFEKNETVSCIDIEFIIGRASPEEIASLFDKKENIPIFETICQMVKSLPRETENGLEATDIISMDQLPNSMMPENTARFMFFVEDETLFVKLT